MHKLIAIICFCGSIMAEEQQPIQIIEGKTHPKRIIIFSLKDGREIQAIRMIETETEVRTVDQQGRNETILKEDITGRVERSIEVVETSASNIQAKVQNDETEQIQASIKILHRQIEEVDQKYKEYERNVYLQRNSSYFLKLSGDQKLQFDNQVATQKDKFSQDRHILSDRLLQAERKLAEKNQTIPPVPACKSNQ